MSLGHHLVHQADERSRIPGLTSGSQPQNHLSDSNVNLHVWQVNAASSAFPAQVNAASSVFPAPLWPYSVCPAPVPPQGTVPAQQISAPVPNPMDVSTVMQGQVTTLAMTTHQSNFGIAATATVPAPTVAQPAGAIDLKERNYVENTLSALDKKATRLAIKFMTDQGVYNANKWNAGDYGLELLSRDAFARLYKFCTELVPRAPKYLMKDVIVDTEPFLTGNRKKLFWEIVTKDTKTTIEYWQKGILAMNIDGISRPARDQLHAICQEHIEEGGMTKAPAAAAAFAPAASATAASAPAASVTAASATAASAPATSAPAPPRRVSNFAAPDLFRSNSRKREREGVTNPKKRR
ncbi:hypothetical protein CONLIGDRAFT_686303 [Coniochaeta ligniaria NRRL 30616]|uniref:Uncharacterized protein n=1 Tax=Coniochaeta ligniaria NRRL 30616 TaxID=1408157 RepID=A0A1J7ISL7_9PEZI|nr:hypothetical protein CONLIGDRAFT_686303 [Coniochaeta ligniaria NRRL 30616]